MWDVEGTDEFADWFGGLSRDDQVKVEASIEWLEERGPGLGRPWVASLEGTRLKELIARGSHIRILFRFDPRQTGILLIGGNKEGSWDRWYKRMIPEAETLYETYLDELRKEGSLK